MIRQTGRTPNPNVADKKTDWPIAANIFIQWEIALGPRTELRGMLQSLIGY